MIKLFKRDPMTYSPFATPESVGRLKSAGITLVDRASDCDIVISRFFRRLALFRLLHPTKRYLVWTHEPRHDTHACDRIRGFFGLPDVHISNVYTGDIFRDNVDLYGDAISHRLPPLAECTLPPPPERKIVALATWRNKKLTLGGRNIDLFALRSKIALAGHQRGKVDIFGRRWGRGVSRGASQGLGWHERKLDILRNYRFNLCFENTTADYYCTEKIWDSIAAGCLPIYFGDGNRIYEDFPRDSFLDYCKLDSPDALFDAIDRMTTGEFRERMNRCIEVFNAAYDKRRMRTYYDGRFSEELLQGIAYRLRSIADRRPVLAGARVGI